MAGFSAGQCVRTHRSRFCSGPEPGGLGGRDRGSLPGAAPAPFSGGCCCSLLQARTRNTSACGHATQALFVACGLRRFALVLRGPNFSTIVQASCASRRPGLAGPAAGLNDKHGGASWPAALAICFGSAPLASPIAGASAPLWTAGCRPGGPGRDSAGQSRAGACCWLD